MSDGVRLDLSLSEAQSLSTRLGAIVSAMLGGHNLV